MRINTAAVGAPDHVEAMRDGKAGTPIEQVPPEPKCLCGALANACGQGADWICTLDFDPDVHTISPNQQAF
ncbi:hypothetical protein ABW22_05960 [Thiobacillus denitrificans]|uniref:Uncharacterized protein n=1 Tax=Thiobacillus denitrificans TaxID=36861 RepID=A0A125BCY4_THIDE|nr:hypothetical protein ABW22_05960 [Thiobacillus denitrificans]